MSGMKRRDFITLVGGAAAWPLAARAQQRIPRVGFLFAGTPSVWSKEVAAFAQRLGELGWIEGRTVAIEYRWVESRTERLAAAAAEFVELKVDVIVTPGTAVPAVKQVTSVIPLCSRWGATPLPAASSRAWRDQAATSPACQSRRLILPANGSNSYARFSLVSAV